ncbi:hypothetical protein I7I51_05574 [Histoplasma capsulatum]|uniref:Uncharacterized protein n=1 Tax=Ajellomyces capsulatus TaxID=5037 RepID=A0A8A1M460_AJECA|nr:hypothetical protein I7I51_05574 [Histoplasma capsulatum]
MEIRGSATSAISSLDHMKPYPLPIFPNNIVIIDISLDLRNWFHERRLRDYNPFQSLAHPPPSPVTPFHCERGEAKCWNRECLLARFAAAALIGSRQRSMHISSWMIIHVPEPCPYPPDLTIFGGPAIRFENVCDRECKPSSRQLAGGYFVGLKREKGQF